MSTIDIEVKQAILSIYHNYPYKAPQVFGEFIDNAIQSYEDHKMHFSSIPQYVLRINISIKYELLPNNSVCASEIVIEDNAAGMSAERFAEAFKSADDGKEPNGMNEFGMGMKVAACWLGKKWKVESKSITEDETHILEMDIEEISKNNLKAIESKSIYEPHRPHGTKLTIYDVWDNTRLNANKEQELKDGIASIYRYFIRNNEIQIYVNDELLKFDEYEVFNMPSVNNPNGPSIEWRRNVDIDLYHDGKYRASGFIAILNEASDKKRGVVIMRNHRVVMGFDPMDRNVGKKLIGQPGSFKYRRVFGEIEVSGSGFEVAFGKNQIIDLDQLEAVLDAIPAKLDFNGTNLLTQADKFRVRKTKTKPVPSPVPTPTPKPGALPPATPKPGDLPPVTPKPATPNSVTPKPATPKPENTPTPTIPGLFEFPKPSTFKFGGADWTFKMEEDTYDDELMANYPNENERTLTCKINLNHPFFLQYGLPSRQLLEFIKALSIAKYKNATDGKGEVVGMMNLFDQILRESLT